MRSAITQIQALANASAAVRCARLMNWFAVRALKDADEFPFARHSFLARARRQFREARQLLDEARKYRSLVDA